MSPLKKKKKNWAAIFFMKRLHKKRQRNCSSYSEKCQGTKKKQKNNNNKRRAEKRSESQRRSELFQTWQMFSSQSPYIEPGLTLCFCSREIKQPSIYAVYCPGFSMGTFLTGISFNGHYLYLVRAGLFCVSPEIIRLSTGSGRRYACFRAGR